MTDITELAQSLKAAANITADAIDRLKAFPGDELIDLSQHEGEQVDIDIATLNQWYELSSPANIRALVEALEKAQQYAKERDEENQELMLTIGRFRVERDGLEAIRAAAEKLVRCKGRYHSEQNYRALAALFGVKTPDLPPLEHENVHYADAAEMEIAALRQRIAELESRTVTVKQGEVLVTVAGFTGCGKSAIAGEIEIAMKAIGLPVTWANGDSEKRMTGADWLTAIEMYKPTVRIVEENIPRDAGIKVEAE
ncbi:ead/Ea22-like family protein [Raoultella ornithinolytica]|uniref:ead/Ea22-like family protein n=1 Tax=Raoultella ornithinolytica TaxID=54291 RepID=UPI0013F4566D|nr:ead/Ea22-like family protein [Raoultella ornithinolytica]QIJ49910.1 ead/Ea22-like family protein [Raoultella ornithinolytica]